MNTLPFISSSTGVIPIDSENMAYAKYGRNAQEVDQAASASNSCLNPISDSNNIDNFYNIGNCGSTISQQGEDGQASSPITHQTANPSIQVQIGQPPTQPLTIETATLTVIKQVVCPDPAQQPCPDASEFIIDVSGNNANPSSFQGSADGTVVTLEEGDYNVDESQTPPNPVGLILQPPDFSGECNWYNYSR